MFCRHVHKHGNARAHGDRVGRACLCYGFREFRMVRGYKHSEPSATRGVPSSRPRQGPNPGGRHNVSTNTTENADTPASSRPSGPLSTRSRFVGAPLFLYAHTVGGPSSSKSLRNDDDFPEGTHLFHPVIPAMLPMFSMLLYNSHQRGPRADMLQQQHKIIQTNTSKTRAECSNKPARRSRLRRWRMSIKFTENFRVETIA